MSRLLLLLALGLPTLVGCERPFVEAVAPTLELIEPSSLDTVRVDSRLPLAFRATSFRAVSRVEVNGEAATYRGEDDVYLDTLALVTGLNTIRVDAFDVEGTAGTDTLYAAYLPYQFIEPLAQLPGRLGGHAATVLRDGTVLFTGGTGGLGEAAQNVALRFDAQTFSFTQEARRLNASRVGHTASLLPDGRVLILGGSRRLAPDTPEDLVAAVEVYDPSAGTFTEIPIVNTDGEPAASPIRRTEHTAAVLESASGQVFVYLYGGLGPRFDGEAVVPIEFLRTLRFDRDANQLVAIGPPERFRFVPIAGHTQTPLIDVGEDGFGRYLVAGSSLPDGDELRAPFLFSFAPDLLDTTNSGPLVQARTNHAAAILGDLVFVGGGQTQATQPTVVGSGEVFAPAPKRFFALPQSLQPRLPRWGHTATNLGDGRILLVGGFSSSGQALDRTELFLPR